MKVKRTRHHIIPRSKGGSDNPENIVLVLKSKHEQYHKLFGNMNPVEIMHYLNSTFWGNHYGIRMHYTGTLTTQYRKEEL